MDQDVEFLETWVPSRGAVLFAMSICFILRDPVSILLVHWHYNYLSLTRRIYIRVGYALISYYKVAAHVNTNDVTRSMYVDSAVEGYQ